MLKNKIQSDVNQALKQGNQNVAGVLRMALAAIISKEKEKRYKIFSLWEMSRRDTKEKPDAKEEDLIKESALTDGEAVSVISSEIKKRKDAIELYQKGNRPELADKEKEEIEILKKYLPEQLPTEELRKLIQESINNTGAREMKDMGKIMADLMPKVKGKADNSEINKMIALMLNNKSTAN